MPVAQVIPRRDPTRDQIHGLVAQTQAVRDKLERAIRPVIVEFAGTPRSGKSTCISIINQFLRRNEMTVFSPVEGASMTPEFLKSRLVDYNLWASCYAIMTILEGIYIRQPKKYDFVLLDRGLFDAISWLSFLRTPRKENPILLSAKEFKRISRFLRVERWKEKLDLVCLFTSSPREAWRREHHGMLIRRGGTATKLPFLGALVREYESCAGCYGSDFQRFIWLRSAPKSSPKAAAYAILLQLLRIVTE